MINSLKSTNTNTTFLTVS